MHILFDIGKTRTRVAGSLDLESFLEPRIFDTPKGYEEMIALIAGTAKEIANGSAIESAAGGIGCPVEKKTHSLIGGLNFPAWDGKPFQEDLSKAMKAPVFLENDSALVGLGEATHGAGKGSDIVAYITVSTGVGGVRIVKNKIDANVYGFEPGWQVFSLSEGQKYASDILSGRSLEEAIGRKPYEVIDPGFWNDKARKLAYVLNNVIVMWSPDVVVVGGSMMKEIGISLPLTENYLKDILKIFPTIPPIKKAELQSIGGIWGAMEFLKQKKNG
ncbi:MAG: ROK family protein [Candidatus Parcubacteria bacterium]|nr:ROK family protein [Candidatus Parcubacteria bacterium]